MIQNSIKHTNVVAVAVAAFAALPLLLLFLFFFFVRGTNRFKDAVTALLAQDPQSDLTYMIADYMSYSARINRSCVVLGQAVSAN